MRTQYIFRSALTGAIGFVLFVLAQAARGEAGDAKTAISETMIRYQNALNASSTPQVMQLYTEHGVFMAPYSQSAVGKSAVRQAYDNVFKNITLHVTFHIEEIVQMSPEWAFVRTNSAGMQKVKATGAQSAEANQELFILRKGSDGVWRIARYSFSPTNPESQG
jgi:uncharacterized protein (TIGR02246 family)